MFRHGSFSGSTSNPLHKLAGCLAPALCALAIVSCAGTGGAGNAVPRVETLAARKGDAQLLQAGRDIYVGSCAACHSPVPVRDHTVTQWPGIIADMSERTKLTPSQERAVLAYVLAACAAP